MASRDDFLLLALASASDGRLTPVQIQKAMFLLSQEAPSFVGPDFYQFVPYNYGPFNSTIYDDLNALSRSGLVTIDQSQGRSWSAYTITGTGQQKADQIRQSIAPAMRDYTANVVSWIKSQSFSGLLRSIYAKYPSFAVNSVFAH
jgi:DNA-binding PadR family transcriptional regulator